MQGGKIMITIKDFSKLILDNKITVFYINPNDIVFCDNNTEVDAYLSREVIRIIDTWESGGKQFMHVLVSI